MYILNKTKLNKLAILIAVKNQSKNQVHSNGATFRKLHVPIVRNIINMGKNKFKMTDQIWKPIQNCSVLIAVYIY